MAAAEAEGVEAAAMAAAEAEGVEAVAAAAAAEAVAAAATAELRHRPEPRCLDRRHLRRRATA